jgi:glycosyltransferase involved in cell wall biosynthesis
MNGISVIIPTYNRQKFIKEAIQSVIDQEYNGNLEIIISDDGSSDKTLEIAKSFGNRVVILNKGLECLSQGVSSTRNRGLKVATQPYISFLDSDDFYLPNHLNRIASVLESSPNSGFAFCRTLEVKEENKLKLFRPWTNQHISKNDLRNPSDSLDGNILHTNCFLFRRVVFDKIGNFNEAYSTHEDRDMWMRISEKYSGSFVDHYGVVYRKNYGDFQLINNPKEEKMKNNLMLYKNAIDRYYKLGLDYPDRIFNLKHKLSAAEHNNNKLLHYLNYTYLMFRYPLPFLHTIPYRYSKLFKKKKPNEWYELSHFLNNDKYMDYTLYL